MALRSIVQFIEEISEDFAVLDFTFRSLFFSVCIAGAGFLLHTMEARASTLKIGGTGAALGTMRMLADAFEAARPGVDAEVAKSLGSGGGIRAAIAGAIDIGLSSRPLKPAEVDAGAIEVNFAKTLVVFVTNRGRVGENATSKRIVDIFSGARLAWADGTRIRVILRPKDESDYKILIKTFPGMESALKRARKLPGIPVAYSDQEAMERAEDVAGSLTTATYTAVLSEGRALTPIAVDGIAPTLENLAKGTYSMSKTLRIVTGPKVSDLARDFIRFVRSEIGAEILRKTGNIPQ